MTEFSDWIGHSRKASDTVTPRLVQEFRATLAGTLEETAPLVAMQWCLAPEIYPPTDLGRDSHPKLGLFLPDLGLPRRMWAGGQISYHGELSAGDEITRQTEIRDITFKEGRSGRLGFVTLEHSYSCGEDLRIKEVQNIVYREDPSPTAATPRPPKPAQWTPIKAFRVTPTSTLLFRYSAITFNGHRIHYDREYATGIEGYEGLVVHGPLQSTWMQILATELLGHLPMNFTYRGLSPLICDRPAMVEAVETEGGLSLRVRDIVADVVTMEAKAR